MSRTTDRAGTDAPCTVCGTMIREGELVAATPYFAEFHHRECAALTEGQNVIWLRNTDGHTHAKPIPAVVVRPTDTGAVIHPANMLRRWVPADRLIDAGLTAEPTTVNTEGLTPP